MVEKKKILLIALYYFENLGDPLYILTTKKLIEKFCDSTVDIADIYGYTEIPKNVSLHETQKKQSLFILILKKGFHLLRRIIKRILLGNRQKQRVYEFRKMYKNMIQGYDVVIIPGGGYVYFNEYDFHLRIGALQRECEKAGIAFAMNAVGISIIYNKPWVNVPYWKSIIDSKSLAYISLRDGVNMLEKICNRPLKQVACSATLTGDLFGIKKQADSNIIGVGVIRGNAFSSNGLDFNEDDMIDFYVSLIEKIKETGYTPKLFINGLPKDHEIAMKIVNRLNDDEIYLSRAKTPEELVEQISTFKAVICARMHAAITAFSLDIPTVLFCWGEKGKAFMDMAGAGEFALYPDKMQPEYAVEMLHKAINVGWNQEKRKELQASAEKSVVDLLKTVGAID